MNGFKARIDEFRTQLSKERKERSVNNGSQGHVFKMLLSLLFTHISIIIAIFFMKKTLFQHNYLLYLKHSI